MSASDGHLNLLWSWVEHLNSSGSHDKFAILLLSYGQSVFAGYPTSQQHHQHHQHLCHDVLIIHIHFQTSNQVPTNACTTPIIQMSRQQSNIPTSCAKA